MKPLLILGEDSVIYRLDPSAVCNTDDIINKIAHKKFSTVYNFTKMEVAVGCEKGEPVYASHPFHLSISNNSDCIYWSHIPGLIFDTKFSLVEHGGQTRIIPDLDNLNPDSVNDKLFWNVDVQNSLYSMNLFMKLLFAVVIQKKMGSFNKGQTTNVRGDHMKCHLMFQVFSSTEKKLIGNYLPCIPNVYADGSICMGGQFEATITEAGKCSIDSNIQKAVRWFFESKMNRDLLNAEVERGSIASTIFGWDCNKKQVRSLNPITDKTFVKKVGNYYLDGLPVI